MAVASGATPAGPISRASSRSGRAGPSDRVTFGVWHAGPDARVRPGASPGAGLDVEVQRELVGVRPEPHSIELVFTLVLEPGLDEVRREDITLQEKVVIPLEVVEHDVE